MLSEELVVVILAMSMRMNLGMCTTIPSNSSKQVPVVCFCSHVDTAPDYSGTNVKPLLHKIMMAVILFYPTIKHRSLARVYPT